jgi:hypothetical protein
MHLAVAVGTPTISLHGPSRAEWCGAYGPANARLQVRYEAGSSLERRKADDSAMHNAAEYSGHNFSRKAATGEDPSRLDVRFSAHIARKGV